MNIFAYGGQVTLIGLSIVFSALIILICCIYGLSFIIRALTKKKEKPAAEVKPAPAVVPAAEPVVPVEEIAAEAEDEGEEVTDPQIIAVIAAAIACSDANTKLVIRSVKRSSAWKKTARSEAVCRF